MRMATNEDLMRQAIEVAKGALASSDVPIGAIVYIKASPEICLERVNTRAREGENIPLEYLKECDKYHGEWINSENIPKLIINANIDINKNPEEKIGILHQIDEFIKSL